VSINGETAQALEASSIVVANASPMSSVLSQGRGQPNPCDGQLDVTILNTADSSSEIFSKLAAQAISQGSLALDENENFQHHYVQEVCIQLKSQQDDTGHNKGSIHYSVDGELHEASQIHIKLIPKAFKMFVSKQTSIN
jgi:diacylglycerol kinase family enzyme